MLLILCILITLFNISVILSDGNIKAILSNILMLNILMISTAIIILSNYILK